MVWQADSENRKKGKGRARPEVRETPGLAWRTLKTGGRLWVSRCIKWRFAGGF